jgi:bacteriocin-like protein
MATPGKNMADKPARAGQKPQRDLTRSSKPNEIELTEEKLKQVVGGASKKCNGFTQ